MSLTLSNLPIALASFPVAAIGFSDQAFAGGSLPSPLDWLGAPGCVLLVSIDQEVALTNQSGTATWDIPIPAQLSLVGLHAYLQGGVVAPGINPAALIVSNAVHLTVGSS